LLDQILLHDRELELAIIAHPLAGGALGRILPLELEKTGDFSHDYYLYLSLVLREGEEEARFSHQR
jgi:hypothetical protein